MIDNSDLSVLIIQRMLQQPLFGKYVWKKRSGDLGLNQIQHADTNENQLHFKVISKYKTFFHCKKYF